MAKRLFVVKYEDAILGTERVLADSVYVLGTVFIFCDCDIGFKWVPIKNVLSVDIFRNDGRDIDIELEIHELLDGYLAASVLKERVVNKKQLICRHVPKLDREKIIGRIMEIVNGATPTEHLITKNLEVGEKSDE